MGLDPVNSGVISIEVKGGDEENTATTLYKQLKEAQGQALSTEERIAVLEQALATAIKRLAELEQ